MNTLRPAALDSKTLAIGVLGVTAVILLAVLLLVSQPPAYGFGMNDRSGDYLLLTQQLNPNTEGIVVVDAATKQMIFYVFDINNKTLEMVRKVPLDQLPKPRDRGTTQPPSTPDRRRRPQQ